VVTHRGAAYTQPPSDHFSTAFFEKNSGCHQFADAFNAGKLHDFLACSTAKRAAIANFGDTHRNLSNHLTGRVFRLTPNGEIEIPAGSMPNTAGGGQSFPRVLC